MTMSNSRRVTPRSLFVAPTDDVGIIPFSTRLTVGAERDHIGLVPVLARILVKVGAAPRIERDVLRQIWPGPLKLVLRLDAQRLQTQLGGREITGVELIGAQRGHEGVDLRMGGNAAR